MHGAEEEEKLRQVIETRAEPRVLTLFLSQPPTARPDNISRWSSACGMNKTGTNELPEQFFLGGRDETAMKYE